MAKYITGNTVKKRIRDGQTHHRKYNNRRTNDGQAHYRKHSKRRTRDGQMQQGSREEFYLIQRNKALWGSLTCAYGMVSTGPQKPQGRNRALGQQPNLELVLPCDLGPGSF